MQRNEEPIALHPKSSEAFARAQKSIPGGVNSPARAFGAVGGTPRFMVRGEGAHVIDLDGQRYIDYIGSWGPMILGHAHPDVLQAIGDAASRGTSFGAPTEAETRLAELIIAAVPSIEKVRLVNSGTEATMSAIRLARGFTGREKVVKFAGNYHGHVDSLLVAAGSSAATLSVPNSPGITQGAADNTIVLSYNDASAVRELFSQRGEEIAAVILEPVVGNMGCVIPDPSFLDALRKETQAHESVLIYDEVMTGFRVAYGGAQSLQGIKPDLTTLGKIVGGGLPAAARGTRKATARLRSLWAWTQNTDVAISAVDQSQHGIWSRDTILLSDWQDWLRGDLPNTDTFTLAVVRRRLAATGHTTSNTVEKGQNNTKSLPSVRNF